MLRRRVPPPRSHEQVARNEQMLTELARRWATGDLTLEAYDAARQIIDARLRDTRRRLPASSSRGLQSLAGPGARVHWESAKRNLARALFEKITVMPVTGGRRNVFNPAFIQWAWRRP